MSILEDWDGKPIGCYDCGAPPNTVHGYGCRSLGAPAAAPRVVSQFAKDNNTRAALAHQEGGGHYKDMKIQPVEFIHANGIAELTSPQRVNKGKTDEHHN